MTARDYALAWGLFLAGTFLPGLAVAWVLS